MPSGVYTRTKPRSLETRQKISRAFKGRISPMKGKKHTLETRQRMSEAMQGIAHGPMADETKRKLSEAKMGRPLTAEHRASISATAKRGEGHHIWKGDEVSYGTLHAWVRRYLGTPSVCWECGFTSTNRRQFQWANISHEYKRALDDWARLCVKCHKAYDGNKIILTLKERVALRPL